MIKKTLSVIIFILFCSMISLGQNKVVLVNGDSFNSSSIEIEKQSIICSTDEGLKTISKTEILCIIPERKTAYTFNIKKGQKFKFKKKDFTDNYKGPDVPRLFAYKYFGYSYDINQFYNQFPNTNLTLEEFDLIFNQQIQKFKTRNTVLITASVLLLLISTFQFVRTINQINALSYYDYPPVNMIKPETKVMDCDYYLALKLCA